MLSPGWPAMAHKCIWRQQQHYSNYSPAAVSDQRRPLQSWSQHLHPLTDSTITTSITFIHITTESVSVSQSLFCLESCDLGFEVWKSRTLAPSAWQPTFSALNLLFLSCVTGVYECVHSYDHCMLVEWSVLTAIKTIIIIHLLVQMLSSMALTSESCSGRKISTLTLAFSFVNIFVVNMTVGAEMEYSLNGMIVQSNK